MISSSSAICNRIIHALVVLCTIGAADSLSMIDKNQVGSRQHPMNVLHDVMESKNLHSEEPSYTKDLTRRGAGRVLFQSILIGAVPWHLSRQNVHAEDDVSNDTIFLSGTVNLPSGMVAPGGTDNAERTDSSVPKTPPALYVTVRPDRPDNVPKAILDGSRGKSPPILAARFESPVFPFEFKLSEKNLTPEGAGSSSNESPSTTNADGKFWWAADDLIVSARWDSDGVAATRSPEDLVGRNLWKRRAAVTDGSSTSFVLDLQGRGTFGKFATKKS